MGERLGCPEVSLRSGNGLVFGLFYDQAQPPVIARDSAPLGTLVTLAPRTEAGGPVPGGRLVERRFRDRRGRLGWPEGQFPEGFPGILEFEPEVRNVEIETGLDGRVGGACRWGSWCRYVS